MYPWAADPYWLHRQTPWVPPQAEVHWEDWVWQWLHKRCPADAEKPVPSHIDRHTTLRDFKRVPEDYTYVNPSLLHRGAQRHLSELRDSSLVPSPALRNGPRDSSLVPSPVRPNGLLDSSFVPSPVGPNGLLDSSFVPESAERDLAMTKKLSAKVERTLRRYPAQETAVSRTLQELREHSRQVEQILNKYNLDPPVVNRRAMTSPVERFNPDDTGSSAAHRYVPFPYGIPPGFPYRPANPPAASRLPDVPLSVSAILRKYGLEEDDNVKPNLFTSTQRSDEAVKRLEYDPKPVRRASLATDLGVSAITKASDRLTPTSLRRSGELGPLTSSALYDGYRDTVAAAPSPGASPRRSASLRVRPVTSYKHRPRSRSPGHQKNSMDSRPPFVVRKLDDTSMTSYDSGFPRSRPPSSTRRCAVTPEPRSYYGLHMDDLDYEYLPARRQISLSRKLPRPHMLEPYFETSPYLDSGMYSDYQVLRRPPALLPIDPFVY